MKKMALSEPASLVTADLIIRHGTELLITLTSRWVTPPAEGNPADVTCFARYRFGHTDRLELKTDRGLHSPALR